MPARSKQWIPNSFSPPVSSEDFSTVRTTLGAVGCGYLLPLPVVPSLLLGYSHCCSSPPLTAHLPLLQGSLLQLTLSNHWLLLFFMLRGLASLPSPGSKQQCLTRYILVSVTELTCHPPRQPFQQRLFHPGGHVPQVFPTHRRKCPSPTFFKSWGSHPFPYSQVMAPVSRAFCGSSADKIWLVGTKSIK